MALAQTRGVEQPAITHAMRITMSEPNFGRLRLYNAGMGVLHAVQGAAVLLLSCGLGMVACGMLCDRLCVRRPRLRPALAAAFSSCSADTVRRQFAASGPLQPAARAALWPTSSARSRGCRRGS